MRASVIWTLIYCLTALPGLATSASAADKPVKLHNVELNAEGFVKGQLNDHAGQPIAGKQVVIQMKAGSSRAVTDKKGQFRVASNTAGVCCIHVGENAHACRLWLKGTAPPKSLTSFSIVPHDKTIVRGQGYDECAEGCDDGYGGKTGRLGGISKGQLLGLGLLAGAVVAIVLVANDDDDDASN